MTNGTQTTKNNATKKEIFRWDEWNDADILPPEQPETDDDADVMRALQSDKQQAIYERMMAGELAML